MLEQTGELLRFAVAQNAPSRELAGALRPLLQGALAGRPLPKPDDHRGGSATDMFELQVPAAHVEQLLLLIDAAQRAGFRTSGTMERGLGGFAEAWREYHRAALSRETAQPGVRDQPHNQESGEQDMGTATQRVVAMIEGWNRMDLDSIVDCFTDEAIYHNIPMEPVHGAAAIRESLAGFLHSASEVQWDILNIAEDAQGTVLTERLDKFKIGTHWIEVPVMGVFEVQADGIAAWRDYFDLADFQAQMAALDD